MKTNYELKKEIFDRMVEKGYKGDPKSTEWKCRDDYFTIEMVQKWEKAFEQYLYGEDAE